MKLLRNPSRSGSTRELLLAPPFPADIPQSEVGATYCYLSAPFAFAFVWCCFPHLLVVNQFLRF